MRARSLLSALGSVLVVSAFACGGGDGGATTPGADGSNGNGAGGNGGSGSGAGGAGKGDAAAADGGGSSGNGNGDGGTSGAGKDGGAGGTKNDAGSSSDGGPFGIGSDGGSGSGGSDGGGIVSSSPICGARHWQQAVPASGSGMMSLHGKTWLFGSTGQAWTVVQGGAALTQGIPLPKGVTSMQSVTAEMAPTARPLLSFYDSTTASYFAAFWDGAAFVNVTTLATQPGYGMRVHADAAERIYELDWQNVLSEYPNGGGAPIVRGALPVKMIAWNVGTDGTVYVLHQVDRPSVIHPGDTANDLMMMHLPHGSLTWSGDTKVTSNEGWGYGTGVSFVIAQDGSFHVAYPLTYGSYYYRSKDGTTFAEQDPWDIVSKATMIDSSPVDGQQNVSGGIGLLAATDYDHAVIVSGNGSSYYVLRNCMPYSGLNNTWPAERLAVGQTGGMATDEHAMVSILTATGVRQDVSP